MTGQSTYSRQTILKAASMLKALGHSGFDHFLLELDLQDSNVGSGSGLMARTTSLATYALKNPDQKTPEGQDLGSAIVSEAKQLLDRGAMANLTSDEPEAFAKALNRDEKEPGEDALQSKIKELLPWAPVNSLPSLAAPMPTQKISSRKIFLVHGHDEGVQQSVARFLETLNFQVVILHEQANRGLTVIEKFEAHSDVGFAVVLLTPDDAGGKLSNSLQPRARQNVILEWGYFIGRLGRNRVCALKKGDVELPSDILGIVWQVFDEHGAWRIKLAKELKEAGFNIDLQKVMA